MFIPEVIETPEALLDHLKAFFGLRLDPQSEAILRAALEKWVSRLEKDVKEEAFRYGEEAGYEEGRSDGFSSGLHIGKEEAQKEYDRGRLEGLREAKNAIPDR